MNDEEDSEDLWEDEEFDKLAALIEELPTQPDDTDDFDPDPIV